jgi:hypothetical protein
MENIFFVRQIDEFHRSLLLEEQRSRRSNRTHQNIVRQSTNRTEVRVQNLRTENRTEFVNKYMEGILVKTGTKHEKTIPYTPKEKGSVERENRTIVQMARTNL